MRIVLLALFILADVSSARTQTLQITGGSSTIFGGSGAGASLYTGNAVASVGLGLQGGHLVYGASYTRPLTKDWNVTIGDKNFGFSLDAYGLGLTERGILLDRTKHDRTISFFLGSTGPAFLTPYLETNRSQHLGAGAYLEHRFRNLKLYTLDALAGSQHTVLFGLQYSGTHAMVSASGGLLSNRRVASLTGSWRPWQSLNVSGTHQDFAINAPGSSCSNAIGPSCYRESGVADSAMVTGRVSRFTFEAGANDSRVLGRSTTGETIGAQATWRMVSYSADWYSSGSTRFLSQVVTENLSHFHFLETVTTGNGTSFSGGAAYTSNRFTVSVSPEIVFVAGQGYRQSWNVTGTVHLADLSATVGTVTDASGKARWSVYGQEWAQIGSYGPLGRTEHRVRGYPVTGMVCDTSGLPVAGIAVRLGRELVWSASDGTFMVMVKRDRAIGLQVALEESFAPGTWTVVTAPAECLPDAVCRVIVRRGTLE